MRKTSQATGGSLQAPEGGNPSPLKRDSKRASRTPYPKKNPKKNPHQTPGQKPAQGETPSGERFTNWTESLIREQDEKLKTIWKKGEGEA
jgi:hypothetical protein